jgi:hypothetical protein
VLDMVAVATEIVLGVGENGAGDHQAECGK